MGGQGEGKTVHPIEIHLATGGTRTSLDHSSIGGSPAQVCGLNQSMLAGSPRLLMPISLRQISNLVEDLAVTPMANIYQVRQWSRIDLSRQHLISSRGHVSRTVQL